MREDGATVTTAVLFDAGGTLVHVDYFFLQHELRRMGVRVTRRALRQAEYRARAEIDRAVLGTAQGSDETRRRPYFAAMLEQFVPDVRALAHLLERLEAAHRQSNLWRLMFPSTRQVLAALRRRGLTLGVVSNSDGRIAAILRQCGAASFFDVVVDSHMVGVEKPDPRIFRLALAQAGARPEQAVYVGDIYGIDVVGAQRAGLRPLLLDALGCYEGVRCEKIRHLRELLARV
ncbi:MAG: HAD-IA family hydrolase [Thermodesulfobacteriota bacterium]|jgi:putative hydrolase of the HAD superfamily